jgi:hypothetical protein
MTPKNLVLGTIVLSLLLIPIGTGIAYAQYMGNVGQDGSTGTGTLEEILKLANDKVVYAEKWKGVGSGTPYFAADGVIGASLISAAVFGGIAASFVIRGLHGKYAAPGLG